MSNQSNRAGRPLLVWLILGWTVLGALTIIAGVYLVYTGGLPPAELQALRQLPSGHQPFTVVISIVHLIGGVLLFRLKRNAPIFFAAGLLLALIDVAWLTLTDTLRVMFPNIGSLAIGITTQVAILIYAIWLQKQKRLT